MGCARAVLILLLSTVALPATAQTLVIDGNRRVDADGIRAYFKASDGMRLSDADLDAALKAMYRTAQFSDVNIARRGDAIRIRVVENPVVARITFEGNKKITDKQLQALVRSRKDGPLSQALVHQDVERMIEAYRNSGRFDASMTPKTIPASGGRVDLVFEVKEGAKTGVGQILFIGNGAFSANKLKGVIKSGESNLLSVLLDNDVYDPNKIDGDRDLLERFYRARGYADMRVVAANPRYEAGNKSLTLTFTIDEGPHYTLGAVTIDSAVPGVDAAALRPLLLTQGGDVYDAGAIDKSVEDLALNLAGRGRPFAAPRVEVVRRPGRHTIDLTYRIEQGPRVYVERIAIHGNDKTRDSVIRREIKLAEGDAYNGALIEASEARLKKLGFFKSVKVTHAPGSTPDRVVLDVTVEEQSTGNFSIAGGYSDSGGWMAEVGVSDSNLLGRGESGKISVSYGQYTKGFDVGFTAPYLFGHNVSLGTDLFAKQTIASDTQSYNSTVYGASLSVGTPINDAVTLAWRYSIRNQSLTLDPTKGTASTPVQQAAAAGPQWVSAVGSGVSFDTLDNVRNPTKGVRLDVNNDVAGLGGDVKFLRNTDDLRFYREIAPDLVGVARLQTGTIVPWGGQTLPLLNGFFGGPQLVRGFAPNGFGPRDLTPGTTNDNVGGNAYWATSYELQSPLPMVPQSFGLKAAVFADAGSLWRTNASAFSPALSSSLTGNSRAVRASVGAGLIWDSILGPLRVDYAMPLSKANYDVTQRLRFGYGMF